jgi:hypothetical protein
MGRGLDHFTEGISKALRLAAARLKTGRPLAFTYHHNQLDAYVPMAVAILDAGLVCSASLPCPAEMGASIHINGTGSSILDTLFVCRSMGRFPRRWLVNDAEALAELVSAEVVMLREARLKPSQGDIRCMIFGHLIRLAVWHLRDGWTRSLKIADRTGAVADWISGFGPVESIERSINRRQWRSRSKSAVRRHSTAFRKMKSSEVCF